MAEDMSSDKVKNIREWGTFIMSAMAVLLIPIGLLILSNQRYQIEQQVAEKYVSKENFSIEKLHREDTDKDQWQKIGELSGKLDTVILNQARQGESLAGIKEQLQQIKKP